MGIMWPDKRLVDLVGTDFPIIQAPMAGANDSEMAISVSEAGGLGSLPCAMLSSAKAHEEIIVIRQRTDNPVNVNFLCHTRAIPDPTRETAWKKVLSVYYEALGLDASVSMPSPHRAPFDDEMCSFVEEHNPEVVSFHFGLPNKALLSRVKNCGSVVLSSATTVDEALWLEANGCDAIIAQGYEAGGHRGMFLTADIATQPGTFALVPQVVDAVKVPVIAAGGIADGRGIAAAFALGASGVQIGTAYLFTQESLLSDLYREVLSHATDNTTALTNLFSGRPARGVVNKVMREVGPMSIYAPEFPHAGAALAPLKAKAEETGATDFSSVWAGQSARLGQDTNARALTRQLVLQAQKCLDELKSTK